MTVEPQYFWQQTAHGRQNLFASPEIPWHPDVRWGDLNEDGQKKKKPEGILQLILLSC